MKLYIKPGACSMAPHIALNELGLSFEIEKVNSSGAERTTESGRNYYQINPKGYVPALETQTGDMLTECLVILQYIADRAPQSGLAPLSGSFERYKLQEWLAFVSTEVHKNFGPLWSPATPPEYKATCRQNLARRFDWLNTELSHRSYLMGSTFTVADIYLFTVLNWCGLHKISLAKWPALAAFQNRVGSRPAVLKTLKAEGLL